MIVSVQWRHVCMTHLVRTQIRRLAAGIAQLFQMDRRTWLETNDKGLWIKGKRWPLRPWRRFLPWQDVREIQAVMRDCFTMHVLSLDFVTSNGKRVRVDEIMEGWSDLVTDVSKRFSGFDLECFQQIKSLPLREGSATCWRSL